MKSLLQKTLTLSRSGIVLVAVSALLFACKGTLINAATGLASFLASSALKI